MICVKNVTKSFDGKAVIDGMELELKTGSVYGIAGSNGAGKSTLLRLINGIYKPDKGEITADGEPVWENPAVKSRFAFVSDEYYFEPGVNIKSLVKTYGLLYPEFDREKCLRLADELGLNVKKSVSSFSKGMKRQVSLILALCRNTDYLFFDETFDGLDPIMRTRFKNLINDEVISRGATAALTSHSLRELEDVCDELIIIHNGAVVYESAVDVIKSSYFKVQVAYDGDRKESVFDGITVLDKETRGAVTDMTVKGERAVIEEILTKTKPVLFDIMPLSLEEFFVYILKSQGYGVDCGKEEKK